MRRIKLVIAYEGTEYAGWQKQPACRTIAGEIEKALLEFLNESIHVIGASRTDAGVHAYGQVAVFDTQSNMEAKAFRGGLKQYLPDNIVIQGAEEVAMDFHPSYDCCSKTYEYRILNRSERLPMYNHIAHFERRTLNIDTMNHAAEFLIGEHDYKSFCSVHTTVKSTVRTIFDLEVTCEGHMVIIRVTGNGFLYNMVRIIAGTLIEVGIGKRKPEDVAMILSKCDRKAAGPTAAANGLTLIGMEHDYNGTKKIYDDDLSPKHIAQLRDL